MNPYKQGKCQSVVHLIYYDCKGSYCKEEKKYPAQNCVICYLEQYGRSCGKSNKSHYQMT
jgi:hypothetical protein